MKFQGFFMTSDGRLGIIILAAGAALPAGTQMVHGMARRSDGYLYVVLA